MLKDDEIKFILQKYRLGICDDDEKDAIESWYQHVLDKTVWDIDERTANQLGADIKNKLDQKLQIGSNKKGMRISWYKAAAAVAAIITILFAIDRAIVYQTKYKRKAALAVKNDIAPGGNKAILTLANGNTIVLDTAKSYAGMQGINGGITNLRNGLISYQKNNLVKADYNILTTPRGGQYQLVLPDGSKVWLNAETSIRFPTVFSGNERLIELNEGEAYFEVVHNAKIPFKVKVGDKIIEDIGTHFDINAYDKQTKTNVALIEGKVRISSQNKSEFLNPGQQGVISNSGNIIVSEVQDVDAIIAWKEGLFDFSVPTDLRTVMQTICRWYNVEVEYKGKIPQMQFGGKITRSSNLSEVLKILAYSNVHYKIEGQKIIVE